MDILTQRTAADEPDADTQAAGCEVRRRGFEVDIRTLWTAAEEQEASDDADCC